MRRLRRATAICLGLMSVAAAGVYFLRPPVSLTGTRQPIVFDFGTGRQGDKIGHVFQLQNGGSVPLTISAVTPNCGCTVVNAAPKVVPAHSSVDLPVEVHLTQPGAIQTAVIVSYTNHDPLALLIRGNVIYQFPKRVVFEPVLRGAQPTEELLIRAVSHSPLHLVSLNYDKGLFVVEPVTSGAADPRDVTLRIKLRPDLNYGEFASVVEVTTDDDVEPVKRISVTGRVRGTIEAEPVRSVDRLRLGEVKTRHFAIISPYGQKLVLRGISVSPRDSFRYDLDLAREENDKIDIPITMTAGKAVGRIVAGSITFRVAVGDREETLPPVAWYAMAVDDGRTQ